MTTPRSATKCETPPVFCDSSRPSTSSSAAAVVADLVDHHVVGRALQHVATSRSAIAGSTLRITSSVTMSSAVAASRIIGRPTVDRRARRSAATSRRSPGEQQRRARVLLHDRRPVDARRPAPAARARRPGSRSARPRRTRRRRVPTGGARAARCRAASPALGEAAHRLATPIAASRRLTTSSACVGVVVAERALWSALNARVDRRRVARRQLLDLHRDRHREILAGVAQVERMRRSSARLARLALRDERERAGATSSPAMRRELARSRRRSSGL